MACTSEGEASHEEAKEPELGEAQAQAEVVAQRAPTRMQQVPQQPRVHLELLGGARRATKVVQHGCNGHVQSVGHTCKDHSARLQPPIFRYIYLPSDII